jgi:hypothetical protein
VARRRGMSHGALSFFGGTRKRRPCSHRLPERERNVCRISAFREFPRSTLGMPRSRAHRPAGTKPHAPTGGLPMPDVMCAEHEWRPHTDRICWPPWAEAEMAGHPLLPPVGRLPLVRADDARRLQRRPGLRDPRGRPPRRRC